MTRGPSPAWMDDPGQPGWPLGSGTPQSEGPRKQYPGAPCLAWGGGLCWLTGAQPCPLSPEACRCSRLPGGVSNALPVWGRLQPRRLLGLSLVLTVGDGLVQPPGHRHQAPAQPATQRRSLRARGPRVCVSLPSYEPASLSVLMTHVWATAFPHPIHPISPISVCPSAIVSWCPPVHPPNQMSCPCRMAIAQHLPCLGVLLGVSGQRTGPYASYRSTHRSTLSSQASDLSWISGRRRQASLGSESEVVRLRWPLEPGTTPPPLGRQPQARGRAASGTLTSGPWDAGRKSRARPPLAPPGLRPASRGWAQGHPVAGPGPTHPPWHLPSVPAGPRGPRALGGASQRQAGAGSGPLFSALMPSPGGRGDPRACSGRRPGPEVRGPASSLRLPPPYRASLRRSLTRAGPPGPSLKGTTVVCPCMTGQGTSEGVLTA